MYYNTYIRYKQLIRYLKEVQYGYSFFITAMSTQNILNDVSVAMLSKSLDTVEDMGDGMVKIMESSVTPYLGQNIDYYV